MSGREKKRKEKADSENSGSENYISGGAGETEETQKQQNVQEQKARRIDFRYNMKVYLSLILRYKWIVALLFLLIIVTEVGLVADKYLLKLAVDKATAFEAGTLSGALLGKYLFMLAVVFLIIIIGRSIAYWYRMHVINKLESRAILDMKKRFFNHIVGLSHGFHVSNKTGSLISRFVRAGSGVERMTDTIFFDMVPLVVQIATVVVSLLIFDFVSALVVFIVVALFLAYSLIVNLKIRRYNLIANDKEDEEKAYVADVFTNIDSIKYFGKEAMINRKYSEKSTTTKNAVLKAWDFFRGLTSIQVFIIGAGLLALMVTPFIRFTHGEISLAEVIFVYTVYGIIINPLYRFVGGMRSYYRAMSDFDEFFKYELVKNDIVDAPDAKQLKVSRGKIEFRKISFSYKSRRIIDCLNMKVPAGKKVALVGSSGAGKTTVVKLLYRLYDVQDGEILIDGENINRFNQESLRGELSIVPQDCVLFDDTIYNNIAFSRPETTREEVLEAIKLAQLDRIISRMPKKEETIVGERGVKLSGGERQRVSIARAILADKRILVLDEATSSLDSETEHEIQRALHKLMEGRTSIIIAHRLSTVMSADMIVVLDEGKVAQIGTHAELIRHKGIYRKLWNLQKGGYLE